MTKKEFKERCSFHTYTGWNGRRIKHNAIYFDWQAGSGFKYAVAMNIVDGTKAELFEAMYKWLFESIALPYYIRYRCAESDEKRFKVGLSLNF
jgi:hypothetical protein